MSHRSPACRLVRCARFALIASPAFLHAQEPAYRQFTAADGLPSQVVYCAAQDREGYMWFGTDGGACRFDGSTFKTFTTSDGLSDNEVLKILCDSRGRVWFLTLNGELSYFKDDRVFNAASDPLLTRIHGSMGIPMGIEDDDGDLYFGSMGGELFRVHDDMVTVFDLLEGLGERGSGVNLLKSPTQGMVGIVKDVFRPITAAGPGPPVRWRTSGSLIATVLADGTVVGLGASGLTELLPRTDTVLLPADRLLAPTDACNLWADANGGFWLTLLAHGVYRYDPATGFHGESLLEQVTCTMTFQDADGNTWFCTTGQGVLLSTAAQLAIRVHRLPGAEGTASATCVTLDNAGDVWVGTDKGDICRLRNGALERIATSISDLGGRDRVRNIVRDAHGALWYASDAGVSRLRPENGAWSREAVYYCDPRATGSVIPSPGVKSLVLGPSGHLFGSSFGIGMIEDTLGHHTLMMRKALFARNERIYALLPDSTGRLWYETAQRLHCVDATGQHEFPGLDSLFRTRINSIDDLDRDLQVIASNGGIHILHEGSPLRHFTIAEGLCSDRCRKAIARKGSILVATDAGACVIDDPLGEARISHWTVEDGLPSNDVQDIAGDDRSLYLATSAGLCVVPRSRRAHGIRPPRLVLASVMCDRTSQRPDGPVVFVQGRSSLSISVQALVFAGRRSLRYEFRTSPDSEWLPAEGGRLTLTDLPSGEQVAEVRAWTQGSDRGTPVRLSIHVVVPWYRTWWMRTLLVLVALAAGMLLVRALARRRIRRHLNAIEREQALTNERQRIAADVHDDLGAEISSLMMTARVASKDHNASQDSRALASGMEAQASGMMAKIDEIIWSLDPGSDTVRATVTFIQRYAEDFAATNGLRFRADVRGLDGELPISTMVRRDLYLVIKEALRNVAQHANAHGVFLTATCTAREVHLTIEDDGPGMSEAAPKGNGHGLENMRQRIHRQGGTIVFDRSEHGGTRVGIHIPIA